MVVYIWKKQKNKQKKQYCFSSIWWCFGHTFQYKWSVFTETSSVPRIAGRKEKYGAELNDNRVLNGTDPQCNSSEAQPKELSGDQTTTVFPFFSAVQDTKPERGPQSMHKSRAEAKGFTPSSITERPIIWRELGEDLPRTERSEPVHDESNSVGPNQKEVKLHVENTEALKKQDTPSPNTEPPSLNFMDQTSFQIVSQAEPKAVY